MNEKAKESCPLCLAQPCDWVTDPHKATDALFLATADLRIRSGVGEKPMLSDLPQVIGDKLSAAMTCVAALGELRDAAADLAAGPPIVVPITQRVRDALKEADIALCLLGETK